MTLQQLSLQYQEEQHRIHQRIIELRQQYRESSDPEQQQTLRRRIDALLPLWREARELAYLTAHYYDRGYRNNEKYTF